MAKEIREKLCIVLNFNFAGIKQKIFYVNTVYYNT